MVVAGKGIGLQRIIQCSQSFRYPCVFGFVGRPRFEPLFKSLFFGCRAESFEAPHLTLPLFPGVRYAGILRGILNTHGRISRHGAVHNVEPQGTQFHFVRVAQLLGVSHGGRVQVLVSAARETIDKGEIPLVNPLQGDGKRFFGYIGYVLLRIGSGFVVGPGIDAENREITRVARPHPVVCVPAELPDGRRRCEYQSHIFEHLVHKQKILIAVIQRFDSCSVMVAFGGSLNGFGFVAVDDFGALCFVHPGLYPFQYGIGHIPHLYQKTHDQSRVGQLFRTVHGSKSVGQVVVFDGAVLLNLAVAAMVVGNQQPLVRNQFSGTAAAETDDGILEAGLIDGIEVLGRQAEPFGTHVVDAAFGHEARQPHPFVGTGGCEGKTQGQGQKRETCQVFHVVIVSIKNFQSE